MSELEGGVVTAKVRSIVEVSGIKDGEVQVRLVCGSTDLLITFQCDQATELAEALSEAVKKFEEQS